MVKNEDIHTSTHTLMGGMQRSRIIKKASCYVDRHVGVVGGFLAMIDTEQN